MAKLIGLTVKQAGGLDSPADPKFGRAGAFLVVDIEKMEVVAKLKNTAIEAAHGAGTGAAALMNDSKVDAVISGAFGPKAAQALAGFGIEMWLTLEGLTVKEVLDKFSTGTLKQMKS